MNCQDYESWLNGQIPRRQIGGSGVLLQQQFKWLKMVTWVELPSCKAIPSTLHLLFVLHYPGRISHAKSNCYMLKTPISETLHPVKHHQFGHENPCKFWYTGYRFWFTWGLTLCRLHNYTFDHVLQGIDFGSHTCGDYRYAGFIITLLTMA